MSRSKMRKMAFIELGRGELGAEVQEAFEKAQLISAERGVNTKVSLNIEVFPPDDKAEFGAVQYSLNLVQPARKSRKFETVLEDNLSVRGVEVPLEQMDLLGEEEDNSVPFKKSLKK